MRTKAALRFALYAAVATAALALLVLQAEGAPAGGAAMTTPGAFELARTDGTTLDSIELDGAPYALMFGFTHCPDVCPTALAEVTTALETATRLGAGYRVYFVAVDEARDTPDAVKAYLEPFDRRIVGLTGDRGAIAQATRAFGAAATRRDFPGGGYTMEHTAALFLVDSNGVIADRVAFSETSETMAKRMEAAAR
ncbi:SCO family protein [Chenggangzhangella methanolivorans]|uniref:SCO family protein n=1 Tax=Chenggangzhangella methanolivorans TaxID=1437009 RepID=A0A9E6RBK4_9HYPH|nr:SCO family protein [Chenggangzhangella methanolivorans]QZO01345.1 SCO family protein [Chenggangzhangella methanolivorans]